MNNHRNRARQAKAEMSQKGLGGEGESQEAPHFNIPLVRRSVRYRRRRNTVPEQQGSIPKNRFGGGHKPGVTPRAIHSRPGLSHKGVTNPERTISFDIVMRK